MPKEKFAINDQGSALSIAWDRTAGSTVRLSVSTMLADGCVEVTPEAFLEGGPLAAAMTGGKLVLNSDGSVPIDDATTFAAVVDEFTLDRADINSLIRLLRRVRDAAYGRDE